MSYFLVAPGLEMSLEIYLSDQLEQALAAQWARLTDWKARDAFVRRVEKQLEILLPEVLDWDIKEPTQAQLSFALAISRQLDVAIPPDALRFRGPMHEFLATHSPRSKARTISQDSSGSPPGQREDQT